MHFTKLSRLTALGICGLIAATTVQAQSGSSLAKVNGVAVPQSRLEFIVKARTLQGQPDSPETRKTLRDDLITEEVIAQEALKKGLDKDPDFVTQLEMARQTALVRAYQVDYIKSHPVNDDELRKEYEAVKAQMGDKEYKAHHVLVGSEAEAKDIIAKIKKGAKLEKIAQEKSLDTGSKAKGGELEWSPAASYVQPFGEALTKLSKGQLTEQPVHTNFGYHVIRLDDVRPLKVPPFEEIKQNLAQRVLQRQFASAVNDLRAKAKVE
ncbi:MULTISPECIES: peptidyl-prolyl cis-trans isomerase [unclassified Nitrosospira]|uniref:peptidyl-prolyl cis-trans isomerase n=1 Tax=unclassified Nitrosospira TaxID=2609267 RepID=UPI000D325281|nr:MULTISPECIES: peptidyl-prolyl cis-trans isomerase [unclassified Nitrosospira]PTR17064.1 peptidyl-prolyl cis-trans isomerase C [Nitrosospira sp. Nsp2]WON74586.1 peptidyl-prolyl cis-trans isomerase [Nitrosospira sp. Is2]